MDVTARALLGPLRLWLDVLSSPSAHRAVRFVLHVRNEGGAPIELTLRGRTITFDIVVTDAAGHAVWRRLEGAAIQAIAQLRVLAPGEQLDLRARWDGRDRSGTAIAAGEYTVHGELLTDAAAPLRTAGVPFPLRAP